MLSRTLPAPLSRTPIHPAGPSLYWPLFWDTFSSLLGMNGGETPRERRQDAPRPTDLWGDLVRELLPLGFQATSADRSLWLWPISGGPPGMGERGVQTRPCSCKHTGCPGGSGVAVAVAPFLLPSLSFCPLALANSPPPPPGPQGPSPWQLWPRGQLLNQLPLTPAALTLDPEGDKEVGSGLGVWVGGETLQG